MNNNSSIDLFFDIQKNKKPILSDPNILKKMNNKIFMDKPNNYNIILSTIKKYSCIYFYNCLEYTQNNITYILIIILLYLFLYYRYYLMKELNKENIKLNIDLENINEKKNLIIETLLKKYEEKINNNELNNIDIDKIISNQEKKNNFSYQTMNSHNEKLFFDNDNDNKSNFYYI